MAAKKKSFAGQFLAEPGKRFSLAKHDPRDGGAFKDKETAKAGASMNDITDPSVVDELTGNAAFNSVPVRVAASARV